MTARLPAATKFSVPALPGRYVPRPRLHAALDAAAQLPLTVVVGVPGAGKSVMLQSWLHDRPGLRAVWLSCDVRDADPVTFWLALSATLTQTWPGRWLDVVDLLAENEPDLDDVAIAVVNDLADLVSASCSRSMTSSSPQPRRPAWARSSASPGRLPGSGHQPDRAPARAAPAPRLRSAARGLRDPELRLTRAEVAAVTSEFEVELNETENGILTTRTEGWMAGVQMAAVSLRDRSDPDLFLADLAKTPRAITDFLSTEVLDRQPAEIRDFMLATSILDVLDAESCAAVTERSDADGQLARLKERNLFLIELGRGVYLRICPTRNWRTAFPGFLARARLWLGDVQGARRVCEASIGTYDDQSLQQVVTLSSFAWVACVEGQLTEADHLAGRALASTASMGLAGHPIIVEALCAQGRVAFERGDLAAAERLFEQSILISEEIRPALAFMSQLLLSRGWLTNGRVGEALDGVARARVLLPAASTSPLVGLCDALEGRIAVEIGDLDRAEERAQRLEPGNRAAILQTRIDIARAEFDQAGEALARCVPLTMRERLDVAVLAARIACGRKSG